MPSYGTPNARTSPWPRRILSLVFLIVISFFLYLHFSSDRQVPNLAPLEAPYFPCSPDEPIKRVAIIGAGSAGSSAAYYLSHYTQGCNRVDITVYERNPYIGGRATTTHTYNDTSQGDPVELGASIFVKVNHNLMHAVEKFGLATQGFRAADNSGHDALSNSIGVFDGVKMVYQSPYDPTSGWWTIARLLWQYGLAPIRTQRLMKETVGRFLKMYEEPVFPFEDLTEAVGEVGLHKAVAQNGERYLRDNGIGEDFSKKIIQASTRVNYAQNLDSIHGVETMVCMATDGAMSVAGGNWQIFEAMLLASGARVRLNTNVTSIQKADDGKFILKLQQSEHSPDTDESSTYDDVILAAPYQFADLEITPSPLEPIPKVPYVKLHVTLFTSPLPLNGKYFNVDSAPRSILTTSSGSAEPWFLSISTLRIVRNPATGKKEYLYKIFSPEPLEKEQITAILKTEDESQVVEYKKDITWIYEKIWDSYPVEHPRVSFEPLRIRLAEEEGEADRGSLWYTSGIEPFISTMETSSLMGANIARLIVDQWTLESFDKYGYPWWDDEAMDEISKESEL